MFDVMDANRNGNPLYVYLFLFLSQLYKCSVILIASLVSTQ